MLSFRPIPAPLVVVAGGISLCALGFPLLAPTATAAARNAVPAHCLEAASQADALVPVEATPLPRDTALERTAALVREVCGALEPHWTFSAETLPSTARTPAAWIVSVDDGGRPVAEATWDSRNGQLIGLEVLTPLEARRPRLSATPVRWRVRLAPQGDGAPWRLVRQTSQEVRWRRTGETIAMRLSRNTGAPVAWRRSPD